MTNHTPGPWRVETRPDGACRIVHATSSRTESNVIAFGVLPHNAEALAAAPELVEALRRMAEAFTRHPGNHDERHHAMTEARALLARLEGGQK